MCQNVGAQSLHATVSFKQQNSTLKTALNVIGHYQLQLVSVGIQNWHDVQRLQLDLIGSF